MAPPRAHPLAPQTGGIPQKLAGMQANVHDKIVNTMRGVDYVELKVCGTFSIAEMFFSVYCRSNILRVFETVYRVQTNILCRY